MRTRWLVVAVLVASGAFAGPAVGAAFPLTQVTGTGPAAKWQDNPVTAFNGTHFVTVWDDFRHVGSFVYGRLVSAAGAPVPGYGFQVVADGSGADRPALGCTTGTCLVAWSGTGGVLATRLVGRGAARGRGRWRA